MDGDGDYNSEEENNLLNELYEIPIFNEEEEVYESYEDEINLDAISEQVRYCENTSSVEENARPQKIEIDTSVYFKYDGEFDSASELYNWCVEAGKRCGVIIIKTNSDTNTTKRTPRLVLRCECSGSSSSTKIPKVTATTKKRRKHGKSDDKEDYDDSSKKERDTACKKQNCPFELYGKLNKFSGKWIFIIKSGFHNHPLAQCLEGHSLAGRLSNDQKKFIADLYQEGKRAVAIFDSMKKKFGDTFTTKKHVYNECQKVRKDASRRMTIVQQLFEKMGELKYIKSYTVDSSSTLVNIFWIHPIGLQMIRAFPHMFEIDCTYKTNKCKLPMLQIVGMTSTKKNFSAACALLSGEKIEDFTWALNCLKNVLVDHSVPFPQVVITDRELALMRALENVFPNTHHMLCRWHIASNVTANCKDYFASKKEWLSFISDVWKIMREVDETEFLKSLNIFESTWNTSHSQCVSYFTTNWIDVYKEKFIGCYIDKYFNLGNSTRNRVESEHSSIKRHLRVSSIDFLRQFLGTHKVVEQQYLNIKISFDRAFTNMPHRLKTGFLYQEIIHFVSQECMNDIEKEFIEAKSLVDAGYDESTECGCLLTSSKGIPCRHVLVKYVKEEKPFPITRIHAHWRKLSLTPYREDSDDEIPADEKFRKFCTSFFQMSKSEKFETLRGLEKLGNPVNHVVHEPPVKNTNRGRPMGYTPWNTTAAKEAADESNKRNPSHFEHVEDLREDLSCFSQYKKRDTVPNKKRNTTTNKASDEPIIEDIDSLSAKKIKVEDLNSSLNVKCRVSKKNLCYMDMLPAVVRNYVQNIWSPPSDGNCGFHCVAKMMGYNTDNGWRRVRHELIEAATTLRKEYPTMYVVPDRWDEIIATLTCDDKIADECHWMSMPDTGNLIATCYNIVLTFWSKVQCLMFFPHTSGPNKNAKRYDLGLVGKHFVLLTIPKEIPILPLHSTHWRNWHRDIATPWEAMYASKSNKFRELMKKDYPDVIIVDSI